MTADKWFLMVEYLTERDIAWKWWANAHLRTEIEELSHTRTVSFSCSGQGPAQGNVQFPLLGTVQVD